MHIKYHLEIILLIYYKGVKRVFTCDGSVQIIPPLMSDGGPNFECPASLGKIAGHGGTKMHLCHAGSWFLVSC